MFYFAVLMAAHILDHLVLTTRRVSGCTKNILFVIVAFVIVTNFWWFRGVVWSIDGPINEHWRRVLLSFCTAFNARLGWLRLLMIFR